MTTSNSYLYAPGAGDMVLQAFRRCGLHRSQVLSEHMVDAYNESNLMLSGWSAAPGPNWWATDTVTQAITAGTDVYTLDATTLSLIAVYISTENGSQTTDRIITPLSSYEYAALPSKEQDGSPTSYWFNRQITPQITLWPVPDDTDAYTLKIRRWRQLQDTTLPNGVQPDIPWRFQDAFVAGLAARLATIYAPDKLQVLGPQADMAFERACTNDMEDVNIYFSPGLSYYSQT